MLGIAEHLACADSGRNMQVVQGAQRPQSSTVDHACMPRWAGKLESHGAPAFPHHPKMAVKSTETPKLDTRPSFHRGEPQLETPVDPLETDTAELEGSVRTGDQGHERQYSRPKRGQQTMSRLAD